jgi:hypothetical protein
VTVYDERANLAINDRAYRLRVQLAATQRARATAPTDPAAQKRLAKLVLDAPSRELITSFALAVASDVTVNLDNDAAVQAELDQAWQAMAASITPDPAPPI